MMLTCQEHFNTTSYFHTTNKKSNSLKDKASFRQRMTDIQNLPQSTKNVVCKTKPHLSTAQKIYTIWQKTHPERCDPSKDTPKEIQIQQKTWPEIWDTLKGHPKKIQIQQKTWPGRWDHVQVQPKICHNLAKNMAW